MATQPFRNGGDFTGDVTFNNKVIVPNAESNNEAVNKGQMDNAWKNGVQFFEIQSNASWTESGSLNIALNTPIPEATWTGAYGVEIWWNDGVGATAYKRTLEHYLGQDLIAINSINRSSSGNLVVSLQVMEPFTIPAGARVIIKQLP